MKIWLYQGGIKFISKSGIGKAFEHQKAALKEERVECTTKFCMDYDVVQINTIFPGSLMVALIAKMMRKKVVYYAHSTMEDFKKSFRGSDLIAPFFKKWIKFCYSQGDIVITPTEYSKELLETYGIGKEIINLSNGIDLDYYQRDIELGKQFREKYHYTKTDKVIISVGHYIERKGIEDFVELAKRMPDYQFIWFGYTNINLIPEKIKKLVQNKLPNLQFPGYISKEELKQAYNGSDLFLFLTHEETEGIVLLEALAMKIPILLRDIPIYEHWLLDKEHVYKGKENDEFELLIRDIVEENIPKLVESGYLKIQERSINKVGCALSGIYDILLKDNMQVMENTNKEINVAAMMRL